MATCQIFPGGSGETGAAEVSKRPSRRSTRRSRNAGAAAEAPAIPPRPPAASRSHAAPALLLRVPPGTMVRDAESGEVLIDLRLPGTRFVLAKGGRGKKGDRTAAQRQADYRARKKQGAKA